ncbi:hypothetical protein FACS1894211_15810 [Clostridia bacterium]|nr:hypothetical protein FACS1894211_15810 [Clostridia bacterium]
MKANQRNNQVKAEKLSKDVPIAEDNVRFRGERTAIRVVQAKLGLTGDPFLLKTYYNLLDDIDNFNVEGYTLTDSYDIVQEAVLFLCGHMGKKLTDTVLDRKGEPITILWACFRYVNCYVSRSMRQSYKATYMDNVPEIETSVSFERGFETDEDYAGVNERIKAMRLTERQSEILAYRMSGSSIAGIARAFSVWPRTIEKHFYYIRKKYFKSFSDVRNIENLEALNLTARQIEIVGYRKRGMKIKEIAAMLSVTKRTIDRILKRAKMKAQAYMDKGADCTNMKAA